MHTSRPYQPRIDLTDRRFGRLVVTGPAISTGRWLVLCDCGNTNEVERCSLVQGCSNSCGCFRKDFSTQKATKHGMSKTSIYNIWCKIKLRCTDPAYHQYHNYGGRGIKLHNDWLDFDTFYRDMGPRPEGKSIDRIDNNGNYEHSNCRWSTQSEQMNNTRFNRHLTFRGETLNVTQWSKRVNIDVNTISARIKMGWSAERTLTVDPKQYHINRGDTGRHLDKLHQEARR